MRQSYDFLELGGGQNDGPPASHIKDSEFTSLRNFYPYGQRLVRRNGYAAATVIPAGADITTPFAYKNSQTAEWLLFAFTATGLFRVDGGGFVALPRAEGGSFPPSPAPWCVEQYRNVGYAVRVAAGPLQRFVRDFVSNAGVAAPTTSPTLADGGAGALPAGSYRGVVTFYNRDTDAESNPCASSSPLALGASKQIAWSAIPVPITAGQITSRRLYRTLTDQTGEYFFVAQIDDLTTTTYTDNVVSANLGRAASFRNGVPPVDQLRYMRFWKERCWLATENSVYFSEIGLPESFYSASIVQVFPDNGSPIRAIYPWGDRFVIGKTNLVAYLVGTDESDFALQVLSERHGIASHHSVRSAEGTLIWFGGDNFYRSAGETPVSISTYKVRQVINAIPPGEQEQVYAALYPQRSWYLASVPQTGGTRVVLCYNYRTDAWTVFDHFDTLAFLTEALDSSGAQILYATVRNAAPALDENQHVYTYDSGNTDRGNVITASLKTKAHSFGQTDLLSAVDVARILCTRVAQTAKIEAYRDQETVAAVSRAAVSLDRARPWKDYKLSHARSPGVLVQFLLEYAGVPPISIDGLSFDVVHTGRRGGRAA